MHHGIRQLGIAKNANLPLPDPTYAGMYRIRLAGAGLSDMVNLTRAKDAVAAYLETEEAWGPGVIA